MKTEQDLRLRIKRLLILFISLLILSGLTAFPLETELAWLNGMDFLPERVALWIEKVYGALETTNDRYPFLAYGTDWLAFAHLAIAVFFIGPLQDPVKNVWIIRAGMIISVGIFPLAFIAGSIRGIPFYWQLIDCAFGVFSFLLLNYCRELVRKLENIEAQNVPLEARRNPLMVCPFHAGKTPEISKAG